MNDDIKQRLEYLRGELRAERISWGDLAELQDLADHIEPGDVELLEAAGLPEFPHEGITMWEGESFSFKMRTLEAESTVLVGLLVENATLVQMVKRGDSKEDCLNYINENW